MNIFDGEFRCAASLKKCSVTSSIRFSGAKSPASDIKPKHDRLFPSIVQWVTNPLYANVWFRTVSSMRFWEVLFFKNNLQKSNLWPIFLSLFPNSLISENLGKGMLFCFATSLSRIFFKLKLQQRRGERLSVKGQFTKGSFSWQLPALSGPVDKI